METQIYVTCNKCGVSGPGAEYARTAVALATAAGWLTGKRPRFRQDYCPGCRAGFEVYPCAVPHKGLQSDSIFRLTCAGRPEVYTCGIHAQQVMRELFNGNVISVTVTDYRRQRD